MTDTDDFHAHYIAALQTYLDARDEDSLAVGHELGRRALQEQISMLEIIEHHFRWVVEVDKHTPVDRAATLEFLLQTLAPLDVATRGFLDGTKRYAEQRARADVLAAGNRDVRHPSIDSRRDVEARRIHFALHQERLGTHQVPDRKAGDSGDHHAHDDGGNTRGRRRAIFLRVIPRLGRAWRLSIRRRHFLAALRLST